MTNAFKEYIDIKNSLKRLSYKSFLDIGKDLVEYHLEFSLMLDGRFYGAEWQEEQDEYNQFMWWTYYWKPKFREIIK